MGGWRRAKRAGYRQVSTALFPAGAYFAMALRRALAGEVWSRIAVLLPATGLAHLWSMLFWIHQHGPTRPDTWPGKTVKQPPFAVLLLQIANPVANALLVDAVASVAVIKDARPGLAITDRRVLHDGEKTVAPIARKDVFHVYFCA